jgi:hypothetical protein
VEPTVFETPGSASERPVRRPPAIAGKPQVIVLDLPAAFGEPTGLQYVAAAADPWPGALTVWRSGDGASFTPFKILDLPAIVGRTLTDWPAGPLWRWDDAAVLDVEVSSGTIAAIGDDGALAGGNLLAVRGGDGRWEIVSAARAEMIGERTFRLSRFVRGLAGSEPEAGRGVPAGAAIVRLDEAVVPLTASLNDLGRPWLYRIGPAGRDHADPAVTELTAAAGPEALRPMSPVGVSARRDGSGIALAWIRRTRRDGDAWEPLDVPLGEDGERYEVEILRGGAVLRVFAVSTPALLYRADQEIADFGAPQTSLELRIAQVSAAVGRGFARAVTVLVA